MLLNSAKRELQKGCWHCCCCINKWRNIMLRCHWALLSPGSVPDSVGRAAVQSESMRLFLWTAAFVLTKQNATHWLMLLLSQFALMPHKKKKPMKGFGVVFYFHQQCGFLINVNVNTLRKAWSIDGLDLWSTRETLCVLWILFAESESSREEHKQWMWLKSCLSL